MGMKNESFKGLLSDTIDPISQPTSDQQSQASGVTGTNVIGGMGNPLANIPGSVVNFSHYLNPLAGAVNRWERTDQGVDASVIPGKPVRAPGQVKVLGIIPNWYQGQPMVYYELMDGPDAGKVQYVAEQIRVLVHPGQMLQRGQPLAVIAGSGTGIEYGWATRSGATLAHATSGYTEGAVTQAGLSMRQWLNSLGAGAGNG